MKVEKLVDDLKKAPYGLNVKVDSVTKDRFKFEVVNFAHLQISPKRAVSFSISLWGQKSHDGRFDFNDRGQLLKLTVQAVKIIYNFKMKATKLRRINVIPIFSNGLVRYMNDAHSMFHYLKPVNRANGIWLEFHINGDRYLGRAIAEYTVMALSLIQYVEINLRQLKSGSSNEN